MPDPSSGPPTLSDSTAQILTRQLDALDTRAVVWTGQVWPGQQATAAFEEERNVTHEDLEAGHEPGTPAWRTRLVLELPSLGRVEATLAMRRDALDLMLEAGSPDAHERLAEARDALAAALSGSLVRLANFAVAVSANR
jgi:hypothetical protein